MTTSHVTGDRITMVPYTHHYQEETLRILKVNLYATSASFPSHHQFGTAELEKRFGCQVYDVPVEQHSWLNKPGKILKVNYLGQQMKALSLRNDVDLLYAPFATANTKLIVLLKLARIVKLPIVVLVHDRLFGGPSKLWLVKAIQKQLIKQFGRLVFFSTKMRNDLIEEYSISPADAQRRFIYCPWGVDYNFYAKFVTEKNYTIPSVISSGTTSRDFHTIVDAATSINYAIKIYCKPSSYPTGINIPDNVEILNGEFSYEQICKDFNAATVCLIPLKTTHGVVGLTSLYESLALGTPIIMTKNKNIDIDIAKENIGIEIEGSDPRDWANAINSLLGNPDLLRTMRENCLRLAREKFNLDLMANTLFEIFTDVKRLK